jgi:hypothetical protein
VPPMSKNTISMSRLLAMGFPPRRVRPACSAYLTMALLTSAKQYV